jgi:hypothetical protein
MSSHHERVSLSTDLSTHLRAVLAESRQSRIPFSGERSKTNVLPKLSDFSFIPFRGVRS